MATAAIQHSPALRRITTDLGATSVESSLMPGGDTLAEFDAVGHTFRLRINPAGEVLKRSCRPDTATILSRKEMAAIRDLCGRELAYGRGHVNPLDGRERLELLGRAEIKLSLLLAADEQLTTHERRVLASVLDAFEDDLSKECEDPERKRLMTASLQQIHQKLGV
ncbi:MAG: hypothetical protein ACRDK7_08300 [Solirubrobacteraceae bacterium]